MSQDVRGRAADVWASRGREFKSRQPDEQFPLLIRDFADLADCEEVRILSIDCNRDSNARA
jgi:hypothetical protein